LRKVARSLSIVGGRGGLPLSKKKRATYSKVKEEPRGCRKSDKLPTPIFLAMKKKKKNVSVHPKRKNRISPAHLGETRPNWLDRQQLIRKHHANSEKKEGGSPGIGKEKALEAPTGEVQRRRPRGTVPDPCSSSWAFGPRGRGMKNGGGKKKSCNQGVQQINYASKLGLGENLSYISPEGGDSPCGGIKTQYGPPEKKPEGGQT